MEQVEIESFLQAYVVDLLALIFEFRAREVRSKKIVVLLDLFIERPRNAAVRHTPVESPLRRQ